MKILELAALPNNNKFDKENNLWAQEYLASFGLPHLVQKRIAKYYLMRRNAMNDSWQMKGCNTGLRERVLKKAPLFVEIVDNCPLNAKQLLREDERELLSIHISNHCVELVQEYQEINKGTPHNPFVECYYHVAAYAEQWGIESPYKTSVDSGIAEAAECALYRLCCEKNWLRILNKIAKQTNEHINIADGFVGKKSPYVSKSALSAFYQQRRNAIDYLNAMEIASEDGEQVMKLADIVEKSNANPEKRRIELMVRLRGIEEVSQEAGLVGLFLTVTCPSKYHAVSKKWKNNTPKEAQAYLVNQWAKLRSKFKRHDIKISGIRVAEPHKDGTPHWHLLLFVEPQHKDTVINWTRKYALQVDGDEKGAHEKRFDVEEIDPSKGSAVGYIAKYISKNINGAKMHQEENIDYESDLPANYGADRAAAWASLWAIRQFQFIGAEPVTVWRELRRLKNSLGDDDIECVRGAADKGDWAEFTKQIQKTPVSLIREERDTKNEYGEAVFEIVGVRSSKVEHGTRPEKWVIRKASKASSSFDCRDLENLPWTRVSNCTGSISDVVINTLNAMGIDSFAREMLYEGKVVNDGDRVLKIRNNRVIEI